MAGITTSIPDVPITTARPVPIDLDSQLERPGVPRANKAVSREVPNGSDPSLAPEHMTVIQQHCSFWDRDGDGIIWPIDTYVGFRRLGFSRLYSLAAVPFIHGSFSYPTAPSIIPDPFFRIYLKNMHRGKHGSDSEVYDTEGRFVPEKFEELFSKYDKFPTPNKGGLSWRDINTMIQGNMNIMDPTGWIAERLEWWTLYLLCADENGIVSKEKMRGQYDGSLWYLIASEVEGKRNRPATYSYANAPGEYNQRKVE